MCRRGSSSKCVAVRNFHQIDGRSNAGMATTTSRPRVSSRDEIQGPTLLALFVALVALNALVAPHFSGCPPGVNDAKSRATGAETCAADASIGGSRDVAVFAAAMFVGATAFALANAAQALTYAAD